MKRLRFLSVWPCTLMLVTVAAANPRAPATAQEREPKLESPEEQEGRRVRALGEVDDWLRKLAGRYRIDAISISLSKSPSPPRGYSGMADCIGVGQGPGVQCLVALEGVPRLLLFGRNPDDLKIHVMEVDRMGIGVGRSGPLRGSSTQSRAKVPNTPAHPMLEEVKRYYASPDGGDIRFTIEINVDYVPVMLHTLQFRRIPQAPAPGATP